jgi:hypothetical protein
MWNWRKDSPSGVHFGSFDLIICFRVQGSDESGIQARDQRMLGIELPLEDAGKRIDAAIVDAVVRRGELDDDDGLRDQEDIDGKRAPLRPLLDGAVRFADGECFVGDEFKRVHVLFSVGAATMR